MLLIILEYITIYIYYNNIIRYLYNELISNIIVKFNEITYLKKIPLIIKILINNCNINFFQKL